MTFKEFMENFVETSFPNILYHGAPAERLESILKYGIRADMGQRNFPDAHTGVYLTPSPNRAKEWAIYGDSIGDNKGRTEAAIFKINTTTLNLELLVPDPYLAAGRSFLYKGVIHPSQFEFFRANKDQVLDGI
jgi:hypothetical protein